MKKIRKGYRLGTLVAVPFLAVFALLAAGMPGALAASTSAQLTSSPMTTVKFADSAVAASAASPQGPENRVRPAGVQTCVTYLLAVDPGGDTTTFEAACGFPAAVSPHDPMYFHLLGIAMSICAGILRKAGISYTSTAAACIAAGIPNTPFTQTQWCENTAGTACLNAWGGGPWVDDYTAGPETKDNNQYFFLVNENGNSNGSGYDQLMFVGRTSWGGQCIGDAYNDSSHADTSLDPCGSASGGQGWGTNLTEGTSGCPSGESWFYDAHWRGYLGPPAGAVNGSHFYLNKPTPYCFNLEPED